MFAGERQCTSRPTITPSKARSANFYRRIKRRVRRSIKQAYCKRNLVLSRKQAAYKLFGTKSSLFSLLIHKQGRRHKARPPLCPTAENLDLVCQKTSDSKSWTHSRPAKCGQTIQTEWYLLLELFESICSR